MRSLTVSSGAAGAGGERVCKIIEDDDLDKRRMNFPGNAVSFRLNKRKNLAESRMSFGSKHVSSGSHIILAATAMPSALGLLAA